MEEFAVAAIKAIMTAIPAIVAVILAFNLSSLIQDASLKHSLQQLDCVSLQQFNFVFAPTIEIR